MKKLFLSALGALALGLTAFADEGMWLLPYLQKTNYADMKAAGLKLKATDIYNPDGPSLKDAIIVFGGGVIPETDYPTLLGFGAGAIFGPGTPTTETIEWLEKAVAEKRAKEA